MITNEIVIKADEVVTREITTECPLCDNSDEVIGIIDYIKSMRDQHDLKITTTVDENGDLFIRSFGNMVFGDCYQLLCCRNFRANMVYNIYILYRNKKAVESFTRTFKSFVGSTMDSECSLEIIEVKSGRGIRKKRYHGIKFSVKLTPDKSIHDYSMTLVELSTTVQLMYDVVDDEFRKISPKATDVWGEP